MKPLSLTIALVLVGCAQMGTVQTDTNQTVRHEIDAKGKTNAIIAETRTTSTRSSGRALFSATTAFEGLDASQDGTRQGLKVDKASQRSDIDRFLDLMDRMGARAAAAYGIPTPQPAPQAAIVPAAPPGRKWVLVPADDPSTPQPEIEP